MNFSNKSVIITGAGNGIGREIALHYAEKGANVILADIDEKAGAKIVTKIKEQGKEALFVQTDIRLETNIIRLMEVANQTYGQIDILINNAGKRVIQVPLRYFVRRMGRCDQYKLKKCFLGFA